MPNLEQLNPTTYKIASGRDAIEIGNIDDAQCLAHMKHKRWHGNSEFVLSYPSLPTGLAMADIAKGTLTIEYGNVAVELTAHDPDGENPDGRGEFNIILNSKPAPDANGEYWQILDFEAVGIDLSRVLGLDEELSQERCYEEWYADLYDNHIGNDLYGHDNGTGIFVRTPTEIKTPDGEVILKSKPEHLVHSLLGTAIKNTHKKHNLGKITADTTNKGKNLMYTDVSRDHLVLPRRELEDNKGNRARIEDIQLDGNQIKFKLPKDFIEKAKYPVSHVTGLDPAYTEDMDSWVTDTFGDSDSTWSDYDLFTEKGVPKGAVAEIILGMQEPGVENTMGVRTDGGSLARYVTLHEAEAAGETHCRMFVLCDVSTGLIECYHSDVSDDDSYYLLGYWEYVSFTERFDDETPSSSGGWDEEALVAGASAASKVCHFLLRNQEDNTSNTMGVRDTSSAVNRYVLVHEPETGGESVLDMITKADASQLVDFYTQDNANTVITCAGYFGEELDFVELFTADPAMGLWSDWDISAHLDVDGRTVDLLLAHHYVSSTVTLGARDGDDGATLRYLVEHEAEWTGSESYELTGFSMSAKSNASGVVTTYTSTIGETFIYLMGYFKPAVTVQTLTAAAVAETSSVVTATISGSGDAPLTGAAVSVTSSVQVATIAGTDTAPLTGTIVGVTSSVSTASIENVLAEQELTAAAVSVTSSVQSATISGSGDAPLTAAVVAETSSVVTATIAGSGDAPLTGAIVSVASSVQTASIVGSGDAPLTAAVISVTSSVQVATISGSGIAPLTATVVSVTSSVQAASIAGSGDAPLTGAVVSVASSVQASAISGSGNAPLTGAVISITSSVQTAVLTATGIAPLTGTVIAVTSSVQNSAISGSGNAPLTGTTASVVSSVSQASIVGIGTSPLTGSVISVLSSVVAASIVGSGNAPLTGAIVGVVSSVERAVIVGTGIANLTASPIGVVTLVTSGVAELLALILYATPLAVVSSVVGTNIALSWILVCEDLGIDPSTLETIRTPISRLDPTRTTSSRLPLCRPERRYT